MKTRDSEPWVELEKMANSRPIRILFKYITTLWYINGILANITFQKHPISKSGAPPGTSTFRTTFWQKNASLLPNVSSLFQTINLVYPSKLQNFKKNY